MRILATGINKCLPLGYPAKGCGRSLKMAKNQRRTRGAGSLYQRKDGVWVATQELPPDPRTGKRRRLTAKGKSRAAAVERLKTKIKNAQLDGEPSGAQLPPLSEWLTHWRETRAYRLRARHAGDLHVRMPPRRPSHRRNATRPAHSQTAHQMAGRCRNAVFTPDGLHGQDGLDPGTRTGRDEWSARQKSNAWRRSARRLAGRLEA